MLSRSFLRDLEQKFKVSLVLRSLGILRTKLMPSGPYLTKIHLFLGLHWWGITSYLLSNEQALWKRTNHDKSECQV